MAVEDIIDPTINKRRRYEVIDGSTDLVLPQAALADASGAVFNRTNPVPTEQVDTAIYTGGFFVTELGSSLFAIDARFTGAVINVHDGLDNVFWLASNIAGNSVTFDDATRFFDGAQSILVANMNVADVFEFTAPAPVDVSTWLALEFRVWVAGNYTAGDVVEVYCVVNGVEVGTRMDLGTVIERTQVGGWQSAVFPVAAFAHPGPITGFRIEQGAKIGQAPTMSIDAIGWRESGGPVVFSVAAPPGFRIRIRRLGISILAAHSPAVTNNGTNGLSPLGFLGGSSLANGIAAAVVVGGTPIIAGVFMDHRDFSVFLFREPIVSSDGTHTSVTYLRDHDPAIVIEGDPALFRIQFILSDDLKYLIDGRAFWAGSIEPIT